MNRRNWIKLLTGAAIAAAAGAKSADPLAEFRPDDWLSLGRRAFRCADRHFIADIYFQNILDVEHSPLGNLAQFRVIVHDMGDLSCKDPLKWQRLTIESPRFQVNDARQRSMAARCAWDRLMFSIRTKVSPEEIHRYRVLDGMIVPNPDFPFGVAPPEVMEGTRVALDHANRTSWPLSVEENFPLPSIVK